MLVLEIVSKSQRPIGAVHFWLCPIRDENENHQNEKCLLIPSLNIDLILRFQVKYFYSQSDTFDRLSLYSSIQISKKCIIFSSSPEFFTCRVYLHFQNDNLVNNQIIQHNRRRGSQTTRFVLNYGTQYHISGVKLGLICFPDDLNSKYRIGR